MQTIYRTTKTLTSKFQSSDLPEIGSCVYKVRTRQMIFWRWVLLIIWRSFVANILSWHNYKWFNKSFNMIYVQFVKRDALPNVTHFLKNWWHLMTHVNKQCVSTRVWWPSNFACLGTIVYRVIFALI